LDGPAATPESERPVSLGSALRALGAHRELIENLVARDIKARYKQSTLGIAWAILNPLIMALIYSVVGKVFLRQQVGIEFALFSYFGLLFWNLFSMGIMASAESLVSHLSLITKVYFPREVFPISAVAGKLVDFGFGLLGLMALLLVFRTVPSVTGLLLLVPLTLVLIVFTMGIGLLLSCANLFNRDVRHLTGLALAVWMYLVPNLYPLEMVPEGWRRLYLLNPVAALIDASRKLVFPQLVGRTDTFGLVQMIHWPYVGVATIVSIIVFIVGYAVFKRCEPRFAESV
jgi:ABC-2 type transport system permease protein